MGRINNTNFFLTINFWKFGTQIVFLIYSLKIFIIENKDTINSLNGLLQITNDRLEGFKNADTKMISSYPKLMSTKEW